MRIVLDPGHGLADPGAVYQRDTIPTVYEATLNMQIAHACYASEVFEKAREQPREVEWAPQVRMTRYCDRTLSLYARAKFANRWMADCFVSIHCNAGHPLATGWEVFHFPGSEQGEALAGCIKVATWRAGLVYEEEEEDPSPQRLHNRGIKETNFYVLRRTECPAVLVECGFGTNPGDLALLTNPRWQRRMGEAIAEGILAWGREHL